MTTLNILENLIKIDSQSQNSNKQIVDYIASLFPAENIAITPIKKDNIEIYNLQVKFFGKNSNQPIIFSGHTDTVPTSSQWTKDPFNPIIEDEKIYGLGSSDMKAGLACLINLALELKEKELEQDVYFLFDADEEVSGIGGRSFLENVPVQPGSAKVIVAEPTSGQLYIGQKGNYDIEVTFKGKSFHSSKTSLEKNRQFNAIHKASKAIEALEQLEKQIEQNREELFDTPTQAICKISGGTAVNVIPDECSFVINRRILPSEDMDQVYKDIENVLKEVDPNVKIEILFTGEANRLDQNSELYKTSKFVAEKVWGKSEINVIAGWTQAGAFKKWGDCLVWGPGELNMAHQADEYCPINDLDKMLDCYRQLLKQLKIYE